MDDDQKKLLKWFNTRSSTGMTHDEAEEELLTYRFSESKQERAMYELFAYMEDEEWFEVRAMARQLNDN